MFTLLGLSLGALLDTVVGLIIAGCFLVFAIIVIIGQIKLFVKCDQEWWKAIIPFYSTYIFTVKICELHWAWFVGTLLVDLSIVSLGSATVLLRMFVKAMCFYNLGLKGRRDPIPSLIFGALFPEVTTCVYGYGSYVYDPYVEVKQSGLF